MWHSPHEVCYVYLEVRIMTVTEVYQCFIDQLQNSTVHSISLYEELTILYQKMKEVAVLTSDDDLSLKLDMLM